MAFQTPISAPLTEAQGKILGQLSSLKGLLKIDLKQKNIEKSKQISVFDYLFKLTEATIGTAFFDVFLNNFLNKVFDPNTDKLERLVIKSLSKSLDKNNKKISTTQTNEEWLLANALPPMKIAFVTVKALLVKQIISMIFGPKEKMSFDNKGNYTSDTTFQNNMINYSVCAENSFTVSNNVSETDGDLEFNLVQLKKRLQAGNVVFTISCQDVKIQLPATIDMNINNIISNNSNPTKKPINPATIFNETSAHVSAEVQRINNPQNANAVSKSFGQILVEKVLKLITPAIKPYVGFVFDKINSGPNGNIVTIEELFSNPCELKDLSNTNEEEFKKKSSFMYTFTNLLYSLLCSIILQTLIREIKKLIKNALAKKAASAVQRKIKRLDALSSLTSGVGEAQKVAEKSQQAATSLEEIQSIFNFENNV